MHRQFFAALLSISLGCGDNDDEHTATTSAATATSSSSPTDAGTSNGTGASTEPTMSSSNPDENGPKFISLQTNAMQITSGQTVIFTAVVTDPDGLVDIAGGILSSEDGVVGYGAFVATGQEGAYTIEISWDALQQVESIDFLQSELVRIFRVEFFDQAAHSVVETVDLTLFCVEGSACAGVCIDVILDGDNCGKCGKICKGGAEACGDAMCLPAYGECINMGTGFQTCNAYCASIGESCIENGCGDGFTIRGYDLMVDCTNDKSWNSGSETCDTIQPWSANRATIQCCCSDTQ